VRKLDPDQIGCNQLERSALPTLKQVASLSCQRLLIERREPLGDHVGVDNCRLHRSRSSRIISSAEGKLPSTRVTEARKRSSRSTKSWRRFSSFSLGTLSSSKTRTSAATDRWLLFARLRSESYKSFGMFSTYRVGIGTSYQ